MPQLWTSTIDAHRAAVHHAVLDAASALVAERGLPAITMAAIAERAGIGRATLYKYFADVAAILLAWHDRQLNEHLTHLAQVRDRKGDAEERLTAVFEAFAQLSRRSHAHHDPDVGAFLHRNEQVARAEQRLLKMFAELVREGVEQGVVRGDIPPAELAAFCLHALSAGSSLSSSAAVGRLVSVVLSGLRPAAPGASAPRPPARSGRAGT